MISVDGIGVILLQINPIYVDLGVFIMRIRSNPERH